MNDECLSFLNTLVEEYVVKYHHQFWGIMLDVTRTGTTGSQRSQLEQQAMTKIDVAIRALVRECLPKVLDTKISENRLPVQPAKVADPVKPSVPTSNGQPGQGVRK